MLIAATGHFIPPGVLRIDRKGSPTGLSNTPGGIRRSAWWRGRPSARTRPPCRRVRDLAAPRRRGRGHGYFPARCQLKARGGVAAGPASSPGDGDASRSGDLRSRRLRALACSRARVIWPPRAERGAHSGGGRHGALRTCLTGFAPYGLRARCHHLTLSAAILRRWEADPDALSRAVEEAHEARVLWLARANEYAAQLRAEKQAGRRAVPNPRPWWLQSWWESPDRAWYEDPFRRLSLRLSEYVR